MKLTKAQLEARVATAQMSAVERLAQIYSAVMLAEALGQEESLPRLTESPAVALAMNADIAEQFVLGCFEIEVAAEREEARG